MEKKKTYIVVDLEATCYERNQAPKGFKSEIIEIGAVKCDEHGNSLEEFQGFVCPARFPELSDFCKGLTTITQDDVDDALDFPEVFKQFMEWCKEGNEDNELVFVSWGHYDKNQFRDDCGLHRINKGWIGDNNHISLKHKHAEWNGLEKGHGLGRACREERIKFTGTAHRGIDDAINVAKILKKYIAKVAEIKTSPAVASA